MFIWFLLNPQYFTCSTNIKFILEHLSINLSVLEIYYFCPILKKSKWSCAIYGNPKWRHFLIHTCRKPTTTMDYLLATYTNSTGLGTLVTLASTYVPSKVACTYTYDASQLRKFNHLHEQQLSHCSCMQFWALQRPVNSLIALVCNHTSTNLLPNLDMYYNIIHLLPITKSSMNMCLNDHSRSSLRTFWALSPPSILETLSIPWDGLK